MPLEKLNAALIGAIQNSTPEYTNAAAILTDKLNIGREAAYRRLRGEVPFTFGEAGVLSAQMNFSLDRTVGALDFGNVLFRLSFSDYHTALEDYTGVIDQDTLFYREVSSDVDAEQAIAGNSFPRMLYMRYPKLTNFKLFKWLYQQGLIDCSGAKFEDMKVPEVLLQSYRDLVHEAQLMPATTLIFDGSCTKRWVNAICAFRNMHLIRDESVEVLKAELLQMLDDLEEDTVDFVPNFDNSEKEPSVLPARLPNLLVNGSAGIAVGMATNIPPHNLRETIDACRHLLHKPDATIDELIARMPAPDFPTGAIIYGLKGVHEGYRTGRGRVIMRAHTHFEETKSGRQVLVVDDIPYQVNKKVLVESIARLMRDKKIEGISELRDESSKTVRIVMELKAGTFGEVVRNNLFKLTQLQWSFGINMVALVDGRPRVLNLREIIEAFLRHRREVINRRTIFRLNKNRMRGHILEGQAVALSNLDEFLRIIRNAPNPPIAREQLMSRGWKSDLVSGLLNAAFNPQDYRPQDIDACYGLQADGLYHLSPVQADKILQMALQKLTGLEQDKINDEYRQANAQITDLLDILARPERVVKIMDDELAELKDKFGDDRRSEIDPSGDPNFNPLDFVPEETMVVTLSREGYIKRQSLTEYRSQRRGGQGKAAAKLKEGDEIDRIITASSHDQALCFSNFGRVYALPIYQIPEGSRTSKGKAIVNLLDIAEGESIVTILPVSRFDESHYVFLATVNGVMKKTSLKEFAVIRSVGKAAIALDDGDSILTAVITDGTQDIMVFGSNGKVLRFDENEVRPMGRAARGVLTMKLPEGHKCISMFAVHADTNMEVLTVCANGYGKRGRRSQGQIAIMTSERNGELVAATLVNVEDTVLVLTNNGRMIRTTVESIRQSGRATQGVKLMETLDETVVSVTRVANEDSEDVSTDAESHGASALAAETTADSGEFPVPASDENGENK